ncbi:MAG: hypothetical protein SWY16_25025 [Cyanobacteriota bacterium]|nr:hypothetical protein [Cyanobacteriota bacterium]
MKPIAQKIKSFLECMPQHEFNDTIHISPNNHYIYFSNHKVACSTIKATLQNLEAETLNIDLPQERKIHDKRQSLLQPR